MNNPLIIGAIAFAIILAGTFLGWKVRDYLPEHHLTDETKNLVSLSMTVVATISALVLGLLISNANTSFNRVAGEVTTLSAEILRLDQILRRYGSDTDLERHYDSMPNRRLTTCSPTTEMCSSNLSRAWGALSISRRGQCMRLSISCKPNISNTVPNPDL